MNRHRCQPAQLRYTSMEEITGDLVALTYRCPTCNRSYLYPIRYRAITASRADGRPPLHLPDACTEQV